MSTKPYKLIGAPGRYADPGVVLGPGICHLSAAQAAPLLAAGVIEPAGTPAVPAGDVPASDTLRVHEVARHFEITSRTAVSALRHLGHDVTSHSNTVPAYALEQMSAYLADDPEEE